MDFIKQIFKDRRTVFVILSLEIAIVAVLAYVFAAKSEKALLITVEMALILIMSAAISVKHIKFILLPLYVLSAGQFLHIVNTGNYVETLTLLNVGEAHSIGTFKIILLCLESVVLLLMYFLPKGLTLPNKKTLGVIILVFVCMESYRKIPFPIHAAVHTIKQAYRECVFLPQQDNRSESDKTSSRID